MSGVDDFNEQIEDFAKQEVRRVTSEFQRRIGFEALSRIVSRTPVDLGMLRGNWQVQTGSPNVPQLSRVDMTETRGGAGGGATMEEGKARLAMVQPGETFYIANSLPYAQTVEFGGYPNPPKHGSRIRSRDLPSRRRKGIRRSLRTSGIKYIVKSAGGFSIQSPAGMVRITAQELSGFEG